MAGAGVPAAPEDGDVGVAPEPEREPAENRSEEGDAEDAGLEDGEAQVARDRVERGETVAPLREGREPDPYGEGEDGPEAS